MQRYLCVCSYDGTKFCGFQKQKEGHGAALFSQEISSGDEPNTEEEGTKNHLLRKDLHHAPGVACLLAEEETEDFQKL